MVGGSATVTLTPTDEQHAARQHLGYGWVVDGMTPDGTLHLITHNGVHYVRRRVFPDGSSH